MKLRRLSGYAHPLHYIARHLREQPLRFLTVIAAAILLLGGLTLYLIEHDSGGVPTLLDGIWLAASSATTSESWDIAPHSGAGRTVAVVIAVLGLLLSGSFVATITSMILHAPEPTYERAEYKDLCRRLERIEAQLGELREKS